MFIVGCGLSKFRAAVYQDDKEIHLLRFEIPSMHPTQLAIMLS